MELRKGKLLYEGKTKKLYSTNDPERLIFHFKDEADDDKGKIIKNKGSYNNTISSSLFKFLEGYHIQTHFVQVLRPNEMLVKKMEIIPIKVVVWNFASGTLSKRYGISKGKLLTYPILEYYLKDNKLRDPMINMDHACAFGYANPEEMQSIDRITRKINAVLKSFFDRRDLKLVDFELEFGRYRDQILVGDEISLDTCHLWDVQTGESQPKECLRLNSDNIEETYEELKSRLCL